MATGALTMCYTQRTFAEEETMAAEQGGLMVRSDLAASTLPQEHVFTYDPPPPRGLLSPTRPRSLPSKAWGAGTLGIGRAALLCPAVARLTVPVPRARARPPRP